MVQVNISNSTTRNTLTVNEAATTVADCFEQSGIAIGNAKVSVNGRFLNDEDLGKTLSEVEPGVVRYSIDAIVKQNCAC